MKRMHINPNAYYNYKKHRKNAKRKNKGYILKTISELYHSSNGIMGYRQMRLKLAEKHIFLSKNTVRKYMNVELGLKSVTRRAKKHYYKGAEPYAIYENLLNQDFRSEKRNHKWCVDFTYIYFGNKRKRYNCTIIDLYDRRVVASVCGNKINAELAVTALNKALNSSNIYEPVILHSDRGSQFTSKEFVEFCKNNNVRQSMSKPGCPYDNAPMERYFNTLKVELLNIHTFDAEKDLYEAILRYSYGWYNNQRPHSYNNGLPPAKVA